MISLKDTMNWLKTNKHPLYLCLVTMLVIAVMELRYPYYFLRDDNRVQHLAYYVHNLRALLGGEFPLFNFHQYLGLPTTIQSAPFYPFSYLALLLSKLFLGNFLGTIDFVASMHVVAAALGFYFLMRNFDLQKLTCCFAGFTWAFCGFVITVGSCWIPVLEHAAYLPWIMLYGIKLVQTGEYAAFCLLVGLRVLSMLIGYPQLFLYTITFETIVVLSFYFLQRRAQPTTPPTSGLYYYLLSHIIVPLIGLPVLVGGFLQSATSASRSGPLEWKLYVYQSYDLKLWLNGLLAPFNESLRLTWNEEHFLSHIGYLTVFFVLVALFRARNGYRRAYVVLFTALAAISLLWSADIVITKLVYHLPVYNKFRHPFRLALFTSFFLVAVASFGFEAVYSRIRPLKYFRVLISLLIVVHIANFVLMYTVLRQHTFTTQFDDVPFDEPLKNRLMDGRIVSAGLDTKDEGEKIFVAFTSPLVGYNYATLWGLYHLGGYDALVPQKNIVASLNVNFASVIKVPYGKPLEHLLRASQDYFRKWGVKWYVVDANIPLTNYGGLTLHDGDNLRNVLYDSLARPMVYWSDTLRDEAVVFRFKSNSIEVESRRGTDGAVIANVLYNPSFQATIDGVRVPVVETADQQMAVSVPAGNHFIRLAYSDRYLLYSASVSIAVVFAMIVCGYWIRHRKSDAVQGKREEEKA